jgi:hypothetical protein
MDKAAFLQYYLLGLHNPVNPKRRRSPSRWLYARALSLYRCRIDVLIFFTLLQGCYSFCLRVYYNRYLRLLSIASFNPPLSIEENRIQNNPIYIIEMSGLNCQTNLSSLTRCLFQCADSLSITDGKKRN